MTEAAAQRDLPFGLAADGSDERYIASAHQPGSRTSGEAAVSVRPLRPGQRLKILRALAAEIPGGLTREEISFRTRIKLQSVCARICGLRDLGYVELTDRTWKTTSGRDAQIVKISTAGRAALEIAGSPANDPAVKAENGKRKAACHGVAEGEAGKGREKHV